MVDRVKFFKKNYGIVLGGVFLVLFFLYLLLDTQKIRVYMDTFSYHDHYVNVKLYTKNPIKTKRILKKIQDIYYNYECISDSRRSRSSIYNTFYIYHNQETENQIKINPILYKILAFGRQYSLTSNGYYSIAMGEVEDLWKKKTSGSLTDADLSNINTDMDQIILLGSNLMKNNHVYLNVESLALAFANYEIENYLKEENVESYLINAAGQILVGKRYHNSLYQIALENRDQQIYKIVHIEGKSLVTIGDSIDSFSYQGKIYPNFYSPKTKRPSTNFQNITVIGDDPILINVLAHTLYHMDMEEGKSYMKKYPNIQVIWQNEGIVKSI